MRLQRYLLITIFSVLFLTISQPALSQTGDVAPLGNRDGKVDVGDALIALRFALGLETPTAEDIQHGDVAPLNAQGLPDPDGQIKVGDALVILRMALNLVSLEPTEINGIWALYTTTAGETLEDGPMIMVLLESDTTLSLETMDLDGTWITGTGTISDTQITLSWEEAEKTVSLTGTVTNGAMSGTWTDTAGGSGTWRAERALEYGEAEITFPETGDELIKIEEEFGFGSAVFYGTDTEQGPALPLTGFTITTTEGDCVVSLDDQERPKEMTLGTMEVTYTYNLDDSFNYEMKEGGVLIYSGAAISTVEEGQSGSRSWTGYTSPLSAARYYGAVNSIRTSHARSGDDLACLEDLEDAVKKQIALMTELTYNIPKTHPFVKDMQKNPQLVNLINMAVIEFFLYNRLNELHGQEIATEASRILNNFIENHLLTPAYDSMDNEWDDYNGGRDYDFDEDGFTENEGDFNDRNDKINPKATEICNGIDDNCNNQTDEGLMSIYYQDWDGDGHGDPDLMMEACSKQYAGWVTNNTDCDDRDPKEKPGQVWYKDADNDWYSDGSTMISCLRPDGYKLKPELKGFETTLCDTDTSINPGVAEVCDDTKDNDCDKLTDCDDPDCASDTRCCIPRYGCCPERPVPCGYICIPQGAVCCGGGDHACAPGSTCCGLGCCNPGEYCCNETYCCNDNEVCCSLGCIPQGCTCCGSIYCPSETYCCRPGLGCCPIGWWCCYDTGGCCKPDEQCCGGGCCRPGSHCSGGICVPD